MAQISNCEVASLPGRDAVVYFRPQGFVKHFSVKSIFGGGLGTLVWRRVKRLAFPGKTLYFRLLYVCVSVTKSPYLIAFTSRYFNSVPR